MTRIILATVVSLIISSFSFAHNGDPVVADKGYHAALVEGQTLSDVFLSDYEGKTMFLDFAAVQDNILEVRIFKDENLVLLDTVEDLNDDTIYEINLEVIRAGNYSIELVTPEHIIEKSIILK